MAELNILVKEIAFLRLLSLEQIRIIIIILQDCSKLREKKLCRSNRTPGP